MPNTEKGIVSSVEIRLKGHYNLEGLKKLGYRQSLGKWCFDGKMHQYLVSSTSDGILIRIVAKPDSKSRLFYEITFDQINSWVRDTVEAML